MQSQLIVCIVSLCLISLTRGQTTPPANNSRSIYNFNCRRYGQTPYCLNNGTCDYSTGLCDCSTADGIYNKSLAFDCDLPASYAPCPANPPMDCSDGTCYMKPGFPAMIPTCHCNEGFYWDATEKKCLHRVRVTSCTRTAMTMFVKPYSAFAGLIFPYNITTKTAKKGCFFRPEGGAFQKTISFEDTSCGPALVDPSNPNIRYFDVMAEYDHLVRTGTDQLFTFKCNVVQDGGSLSDWTDVAKVQDRAIADMENIAPVAENTETGMSLRLLDANKNVLSGATRVGDITILEISLNRSMNTVTNVEDIKAIVGFSNFHIENIRFTHLNYVVGSTTDNAYLDGVRDGCGTIDLRSAMRQLNRTITPTEVTVDLLFHMFSFIGFEGMRILTNVSVCADEACSALVNKTTHCSQVNGAVLNNELINQGAQPYRRRKRQAPNTGSEGTQAQLNVSTLVTDSVTIINPSPQPVDRIQADCLQSMVFLMPLILLSLMLIVAMLVAVFFCLKVNNQRKDVGDQNLHRPYKA